MLQGLDLEAVALLNHAAAFVQIHVDTLHLCSPSRLSYTVHAEATKHTTSRAHPVLQGLDLEAVALLKHAAAFVQVRLWTRAAQ